MSGTLGMLTCIALIGAILVPMITISCKRFRPKHLNYSVLGLLMAIVFSWSVPGATLYHMAGAVLIVACVAAQPVIWFHKRATASIQQSITLFESIKPDLSQAEIDQQVEAFRLQLNGMGDDGGNGGHLQKV